MSQPVQIWGVDGLPDVHPGDDLAALIAAASPDLRDGDVLVVTSKIVSKAEDRLVRIDPDDPRGHTIALDPHRRAGEVRDEGGGAA